MSSRQPPTAPLPVPPPTPLKPAIAAVNRADPRLRRDPRSRPPPSEPATASFSSSKPPDPISPVPSSLPAYMSNVVQQPRIPAPAIPQQPGSGQKLSLADWVARKHQQKQLQQPQRIDTGPQMAVSQPSVPGAYSAPSRLAPVAVSPVAANQPRPVPSAPAGMGNFQQFRPSQMGPGHQDPRAAVYNNSGSRGGDLPRVPDDEGGV